VLAVLAGVVGLSTLDVAPIVSGAVLGVAVVLLTRCIDADEAFSPRWTARLLALIFAMLAVGGALDRIRRGAADRQRHRAVICRLLPPVVAL
jgi:hypothetical protein